MAYNPDTISAVATPPGRGGIGAVRVSGPLAASIAETILGRPPRVRFAEYGRFHGDNGREMDYGIALFFEGPNSFTGEDVLELHCHGSPVVLDMVLQRTLQLGARPARPGEFSERAFLNDKLDLAQAEAIADLIAAKSRRAAAAAARSLEGAFSREINTFVEQLIELRVFVESTLDFPDEDIDFISQRKVGEQLLHLRQKIQDIVVRAQSSARLTEGLRVVLAGLPNAGKSSLLNVLCARESAIVTDVPGTTRDVIKEKILVDGMPIEVLDTAGLRDQADTVEAIGIARTRAEMSRADLILLVLDHGVPIKPQLSALRPQLPTGVPVLYAYNKIDKSGAPADASDTEVWLSALSGEGIELLRRALKAAAGLQDAEEGEYTVRRRHIDALGRAQAALEHAAGAISDAASLELAAEDLRVAQQQLGEITGQFTNEDLLGRIFSTFCIGK